MNISIILSTTDCAHCPCRESQNNLATLNVSGNIIAKEAKGIVWGFTGNHMALYQIIEKKKKSQNLNKFAQDLALVLILGSIMTIAMYFKFYLNILWAFKTK